MTYNYSITAPENSAKAYGVGLTISRKQAIEVCKFIRNKPVEKAKKMLESVIKMERPVPFTRYMHNIGHRKGDLTAGRYPTKTCVEVLKLIKSAESNAQYKGLSSANLFVDHIRVQQGPQTLRGSRQGRVKAKRTHVEVILIEKKENKNSKKDNKKNEKKAQK